MSISKRLLDLARSNLTDFRTAFTSDGLRDLLHREEPAEAQAEQPDEGVDGETLGKKAGRKARRFKDAAEEAWERAYENARVRAGVRGEPLSDPAADRKRWYRTLELQPGADLKEIRRAYRKMLLQYHPDRYANDPEKYKVATEVTRKLTEAYNGLQQTLA